MFDLAYPLEDSVEINGEHHALNLAFDNVLRLIDLLSDKSLSDAIQIEIGLEMLIGVDLDISLPEKEEYFYQVFQETIGQGSEDNQMVDIDGNPMPEQKEEKLYDLKQDAAYIYASFMSDYSIDLFEQQGKLHWEKFKALLSGLTDGSKFLRVIEIRTMELPKGKGTEKQRSEVIKMKKAYALKDDE